MQILIFRTCTGPKLKKKSVRPKLSGFQHQNSIWSTPNFFCLCTTFADKKLECNPIELEICSFRST